MSIHDLRKNRIRPVFNSSLLILNSDEKAAPLGHLALNELRPS